MHPFREIKIEVDFPAEERAVLGRWQREHTFEQSVAARLGGKEYVFYDGPPFATGLPHYGHLFTSYIKDVVPRYFTMRGRHVPRRWGWDCHGLPVEFEIEKELGFKSRAEIVAYGIDRFNEACKASVLRYADEWRRIIGRLGRWVDFDHDYKTMDQSYMESVVSVFKTLYDKGLVYEGNKVVAYCTRCQTTLSNFEARMDDATRPRQDPAITVRFRLADNPRQSFLAWTTTPWTLPSNVALAVGPEIEYSLLEKGDDSVWIGSLAVGKYAKELEGYSLQRTALGKELVDTRYLPIFPYFKGNQNAFRVLPAEFVTTEDGTGIVHMAPAFGEDDNALCFAHGITGPNPVEDDGTFQPSVTDFAGLHVFDANPRIIQKLKEEGALVRRETYDHNYPHCWRCDSPLIYRAIKTWFVKVLEFKERMIAANQKIRWVPAHIRDGRFGHWLENARDWAISRNRFWGAPIPVWRCSACAAIDVIGGKSDLEGKSGQSVADWHRPAIDEIHYPCACGGTYRRVADVLDCWFESGAMPYAQVHYPFEHKAEFEATFPGDFIVEYIAQTRGWFYTLVVLSTALFDGPPFRDVVCHGVILAEDGRKMSKRLKNYPDPMELVEEHGSDALRIALLSSAVTRGADLRFAKESVRDAVRRFSIPLWNSLHYFTAYARIDGFLPSGKFPALSRLDKYLLSETESLRAKVEACMEVYDFAGCYEGIEDYIVLLSTWYIRLSKQRLWRAGMNDDKQTAYEVLFAALSSLAKVIAPFLPFLAERVHEVLGSERSVHLEDWPTPKPEWLDGEIVSEMRAIRTVVRLARSVREEHKLKHRHPLRSIAVAGLSKEAVAHNLELLLEELNVKEVKALSSADEYVDRVVKLDFAKLGRKLRDKMKQVAAAIAVKDYRLLEGGRLEAAGVELDAADFSYRSVPRMEGLGVAAEESLVVVLDLTCDPALMAEGEMRDLNRGLQDLRKKAGLAYAERVNVAIVASEAVWKNIAAHEEWLLEQVLAKQIVRAALPFALATEEVEVGDERVAIGLERA